MRASTGSLWRHRNFVSLWAATAISDTGSQVSALALPLLALSVLHTDVLGVGLLRAAESVPYLLIGLPAGVWVERRSRRRVLVGTDILRLAALGSIPLADAAGFLGLAQVLIVAVAAGSAKVLFDVAFQAYLPRLVAREQLVEGNAKLTVSQTVALVAGPGLAGLLVGTVGAAPAVAVDAASFALSALAIASIRLIEPRTGTPGTPSTPDPMVVQVRAGLRFVLGSPVLRAITSSVALANFGLGVIDAALIVFMVRSVGLSPAQIGLVFLLSGLAGVVAAFAVAARVSRLTGTGWACIGGATLALVGQAAIASAPTGTAGLWVLGAAQGTASFGVVVFNVNQVSLRQVLCPDGMQGRMTATIRTFAFGAVSLGSVTGGVAGTVIGLRPTLVLAAVVALAAVATLLSSPLRHVTTLDGAVGLCWPDPVPGPDGRAKPG